MTTIKINGKNVDNKLYVEEIITILKDNAKIDCGYNAKINCGSNAKIYCVDNAQIDCGGNAKIDCGYNAKITASKGTEVTAWYRRKRHEYKFTERKKIHFKNGEFKEFEE